MPSTKLTWQWVHMDLLKFSIPIEDGDVPACHVKTYRSEKLGCSAHGWSMFSPLTFGKLRTKNFPLRRRRVWSSEVPRTKSKNARQFKGGGGLGCPFLWVNVMCIYIYICVYYIYIYTCYWAYGRVNDPMAKLQFLRVGWGGGGVGWGWWHSLNLNTWWMLRNCACLVIAHMLDATQLCLSCHCTHGGCYATVMRSYRVTFD